jgi:tyrosyl-tRNA synthetase
MFGKTMSISDDLMWRYYELLTDLRPDEIAALRAGWPVNATRAISKLNSRSDHHGLHSSNVAEAAEEEFVRRFRNKRLR